MIAAISEEKTTPVGEENLIRSRIAEPVAQVGQLAQLLTQIGIEDPARDMAVAPLATCSATHFPMPLKQATGRHRFRTADCLRYP